MISPDTCLSLPDFSQYDDLQVHPCGCKWHSFILLIAVWCSFFITLSNVHPGCSTSKAPEVVRTFPVVMLVDVEH